MLSRSAAMLVAFAMLSGCIGMRPGFETPTVTVKSVRALPSQGALPDFEIVLHVLNPNNESLKLSGVSYTVSLGGHDVVKGVGNDLPVIEGYGAADLTLTASANLFAGIGLLRDMMSTQGDMIDCLFSCVGTFDRTHRHGPGSENGETKEKSAFHRATSGLEKGKDNAEWPDVKIDPFPGESNLFGWKNER